MHVTLLSPTALAPDVVAKVASDHHKPGGLTVVPAGEAMMPTEASKGDNGYYLISDGSDQSYRTRIRTPSFAHMQMIPLMSRGLLVADLIAILGSLDFVLSDVDR